MSPERTVTVFEHQRLRVDGTTFRQSNLAALDRWNCRLTQSVLEVGRSEVRFGYRVGVIQVGDLTIEVLPKIGRVADPDLARAKWRVALLDMLAIAGVVRSPAIADASVLTTPRSLLDILFDEYLNRTSEIVVRGLAKAYTSIEANVAALRGRIVPAQHSVRNYVGLNRFAVLRSRLSSPS